MATDSDGRDFFAIRATIGIDSHYRDGDDCVSRVLRRRGRARSLAVDVFDINPSLVCLRAFSIRQGVSLNGAQILAVC